jgi:hypothetical protein
MPVLAFASIPNVLGLTVLSRNGALDAWPQAASKPVLLLPGNAQLV